MADRIIAPLALLLLLIFLGFLAVSIGELDLWLIMLAVAMLVTADVVQDLRGGGNGS